MTHADHSAAQRAARAAQRAALSADREYRESVRRLSLPPGVRIVRWGNRVAGLHVQPGAVHLQTERDGTWWYLPIAQAVRGWTAVTISLANGSRCQATVFTDGARGMADVGQPARNGGFDMYDSVGDDPVSAVLAVPTFAALVLAAPIVIASAFQRAARARRLENDLTCAAAHVGPG